MQCYAGSDTEGICTYVLYAIRLACLVTEEKLPLLPTPALPVGVCAHFLVLQGRDSSQQRKTSHLPGCKGRPCLPRSATLGRTSCISCLHPLVFCWSRPPLDRRLFEVSLVHPQAGALASLGSAGCWGSARALQPCPALLRWFFTS